MQQIVWLWIIQTGSIKTCLQHKHRTSIAFTWCHITTKGLVKWGLFLSYTVTSESGVKKIEEGDKIFIFWINVKKLIRLLMYIIWLLFFRCYSTLKPTKQNKILFIIYISKPIQRTKVILRIYVHMTKLNNSSLYNFAIVFIHITFCQQITCVPKLHNTSYQIAFF